MSNIAIEFNNVGKIYRLGRVGTGTLSHDLNRWWQTTILRKEDPYLKIGQTNDRTTKGESDYVWALKDISFKVEQGEVLGIIGKNGAGKSTLLKLLSNITSPTTGTIRYQGRIASLLEVGTGFHPEMTGRENIYMNGSIMGMTRAEITRKLDEIVDFAGVERYLDTPVKRYSSGMTVRLGFAVAAFLEPEILVVDEVLTVGDAEFQKKAIGKMNDVAHQGGRTVLFVSHNMAAVRSLCTRGIVLQNGEQVFDGTAGNAVDFYLANKINIFARKVSITDKHRRMSVMKELEIVEVAIENTDTQHLCTNEPLIFCLRIKINDSSINTFTIGMHITNNEDKRVGTYVSPLQPVPKNNGYFESKIVLNNHSLARGVYMSDFNIGIKDLSIGVKNYDVVYETVAFEIVYSTPDKVIAFWPSSWGNTNYQDVEIKNTGL